MPLPISPAIPLSDYTDTINVQGSLLQPWFNSGEIKALTDLLTAYHDEYYVPDDGSGTPTAPVFVTGQFVFDIDSSNADNGVTDPFVFKDPIPAYSAAIALIRTLGVDNGNTITLLFGNGTYRLAELNYNFMFAGFPAPVESIANEYGLASSLVSRAPATIILKAKNAPTLIADNAWDPISSPANYASEEAAKFATNKALVTSAFNVIFETGMVDIDPVSYYAPHALIQPSNFVYDGIAFTTDISVYSSFVYYPYCFLAGVAGEHGYAVVGYWYWQEGENAPGIVKDNPIFCHKSECYNIGYPNTYVPKPIYMVHSNGNFLYRGSDSKEYEPTINHFTKVMVNPLGGNYYLDNPSGFGFSRGIDAVCIGYMPAYWAGYGWMNFPISTKHYDYYGARSVCPSGQILIAFTGKDTLIGQSTLIYSKNSSKTFTGVILANLRAAPMFLFYPPSVYTGKYTGGLSGKWTNASSDAPFQTWGNGSPESVVFGSMGDIYLNNLGGAGTTLYVKESGNNTNTGWVAK